MRSDPPSHAGRSAADGFAEARAGVRRSRSLQVAAALLGLVCTLAAPGRPWALAGVVVAGGVALLARPHPDPQRWLRGSAGEAATAVLLGGLAPRRWTVLHDRAIPGTRANIDHVVVGPTGVWVIDTKTYRAPLRARRGTILAGRARIDTSPAAWEAEVVGRRIGVAARPVLAVHGAGLGRRCRRVDVVEVAGAPHLVRRIRRRRGSERFRRAEVRILAERCDSAFPPRAGARCGPATAGTAMRTGTGRRQATAGSR